MPRLTEAEYDALEDEITRNPPDVDPTKSRHPVRMIAVDDFSADWLRIKADAAHTSVGQIVHSMVRDRIAAAH
ncbi:MAG: hypothetical protein LBT00_01630 [Spirochaetaceae bacterium]|nr:hypothetical protein [Spirochaetaceae bacterium]